jgi:hypothetical protein
MITTNVIPVLEPKSWIHSADAKAILLEPVLIVGTAAFWLLALPFAAIGLMVMKVSETIVALVSGRTVRPNPLILRKRAAVSFPGRRRSARAASA